MITGNVLYDSGVLLQERYDKLVEENRRLREALVKVHKWAQYTMHDDIHEITNRALCPNDYSGKEAGK